MRAVTGRSADTAALTMTAETERLLIETEARR